MGNVNAWESYYPGTHRNDPLAYMLYAKRYTEEGLQAQRDRLISVLSSVPGLICDGFTIHGPADVPFNNIFTSRVQSVFEEFAIVSQALSPVDNYPTIEKAFEGSRAIIEVLESTELVEKSAALKKALDLNVEILKGAA